MTGRLTLWAVAVLLTIAVVGWSSRYMDPFPPRRTVLATGQADGAYDAFGHEYQRRRARDGLRVDLQPTAPGPDRGPRPPLPPRGIPNSLVWG